MSTNTDQVIKTTGVEDVVVSLATRLGLLVSGVAIQSLLAYALLPAGRGAYAVCVLFAALFGILFTPGADAGAQYYVMARKMSVSQGVSIALVICLFGSVIAATLAIPLIYSDVAFFQSAEERSFLFSLVLIPLITISTALQHQLTAIKRFARIALFSFFQTVANGVSFIVLVLGLRLAVDGALAASGIGYLVMIVCCLRHLRRREGFVLENPFGLGMIRVLKYGINYYIARIGWSVDVRIGVLLLGMIADRTSIGLFAVASGIMTRLLVIPNSVTAPLLARSASGTGGRPDLVAFCARFAMWATGGVLIPLVVLGEPIVRILFSVGFVDAVPLIWIIAPGILVYAGGSVFTVYFRGINRPDICSWAVALGVATNALAVFLLYPGIGEHAAAVGMAVSLFLRSILLKAVFYRTTGTRVSSSWWPQPGDAERIRVLVLATWSRVRRRRGSGQ